LIWNKGSGPGHENGSACIFDKKETISLDREIGWRGRASQIAIFGDIVSDRGGNTIGGVVPRDARLIDEIIKSVVLELEMFSETAARAFACAAIPDTLAVIALKRPMYDSPHLHSGVHPTGLAASLRR
jgi:hypothetical protein